MQSATRERHKAATRNHIADVARRLFVERDYDKVTLEQIAKESQVSLTTVMRHFETKERLALFDILDGIEDFRVLLRNRKNGEDPAAIWLKFIEDLMNSDLGFFHVERLLPRLESVPALHGQLLHLCHQFEQLIAAALAADAGLREPALEHQLVAASLVFATFAAQRHLRTAKTRKEFDAAWRRVGEFLRRYRTPERSPRRSSRARSTT